MERTKTAAKAPPLNPLLEQTRVEQSLRESELSYRRPWPVQHMHEQFLSPAADRCEPRPDKVSPTWVLS
jgi:hypothetical protein